MSYREKYRGSIKDKATKRRYYHKHKDRLLPIYAARNRRRTTGWGPEEYAAALLFQEGRCAACNVAAPLDADHKHLNKKKRLLLCRGCNRALGFVKESASTLRRLALYVEFFDGFGD